MRWFWCKKKCEHYAQELESLPKYMRELVSFGYLVGGPKYFVLECRVCGGRQVARVGAAVFPPSELTKKLHDFCRKKICAEELDGYLARNMGWREWVDKKLWGAKMRYYWNSWGPILTAKEHGVITKKGPFLERMYAGYDDRYYLSDDELDRLETLHPIVRDFLKHVAKMER